MAGKTDGNHVTLNIGLTGFSMFFPATRWTHAAGAGFTLRLANDEWKPCWSVFRCAEPPLLFAYMKHLTGDRRAIRVGRM